jgi:hypothetical protein
MIGGGALAFADMAALALSLPEGQPVPGSVFRTAQDEDIYPVVLATGRKALGQAGLPSLTPGNDAGGELRQNAVGYGFVNGHGLVLLVEMKTVAGANSPAAV